MRWQASNLGKYVEIVSGFAFKSEYFNTDSAGLPLVRIRDVVPGCSSTYYSGSFDEHFRVKDGDLLIGMDGEFNRAIWKGGDALLNQRVCRVQTDPNVLDGRYLYHFLPNALRAIEARTSFVTVKHLSSKDIREIAISLPPIDNQRRIAAILDQADDLRRKRRAALERLKQFIRSDFNTTFVQSDVGGWRELPVEDVAVSIRTGPFGSQLLHSEFTDQGIAVLGIDNAVKNSFNWGERRYISQAKYKELKRYRVHPRDVLVTIMGTCGRAAIVPDDIPLAINTKHLCCLTLDQSLCVPEFLHAAFLLHPSMLRQLGVSERGAVMPGLNMGLIRKARLQLPPIELQRAFASRVAEADKIKGAHRASLTRLDALFVSLQDRAFRGDL